MVLGSIWVRTSEEDLKKAEEDMLQPVKAPRKTIPVPVRGGETHVNAVLFTESCPAESPWLVLCHGYGSALGFYSKNIDHLASKYKVVALDWLGFGRSGRPDYSGDTTAEAEKFFCDALDEALVALGVEKFILAGHSLGGYLSAVYCFHEERRNKVIGLALISPVGIPEKPADWTGPKLPWHWRPVKVIAEWLKLTPMSFVRGSGPFGRGLTAKFRKAMSDRYQGFYDDHDAVVSAYSYHVNAQRASGEIACHDILHWAYAKDPLINRLSLLHNTPVFFMYGDSDWMDRKAGETAMNSIKEKSKWTDLVIISSAGHNLFADNPEEFNNELCTAIEKMISSHQ